MHESVWWSDIRWLVRCGPGGHLVTIISRGRGKLRSVSPSPGYWRYSGAELNGPYFCPNTEFLVREVWGPHTTHNTRLQPLVITMRIVCSTAATRGLQTGVTSWKTFYMYKCTLIIWCVWTRLKWHFLVSPVCLGAGCPKLACVDVWAAPR